MARERNVAPRVELGVADERAAPAFVLRDMAASIDAEARRAAGRAFDQATRLQHAAERAAEVAGETCATAPAEELLSRAYQLRGIAAYGSSILGELELEAGRLEGLASIRRLLDAEGIARG